MNKKVILITAAAGAFSFAGAFATAWFSRPAPAAGASPTEGQASPQGQAGTMQPPTILTPSALPVGGNDNAMSLTETQLQELIFDVREKITEYNTKLEELEKEKQRFRVAQQTLQSDIKNLNNLRTDLDTSVANLKRERDLLLKTRIEVDQTERSNLVAIAAAYDRMDAARASEILTSMAVGQTQGTGASRSASIDDAVKILYYMQERTKAKVLGELVATEPALAALLSQKLKTVTGGN